MPSSRRNASSAENVYISQSGSMVWILMHKDVLVTRRHHSCDPKHSCSNKALENRFNSPVVTGGQTVWQQSMTLMWYLLPRPCLICLTSKLKSPLNFLSANQPVDFTIPVRKDRGGIHPLWSVTFPGSSKNNGFMQFHGTWCYAENSVNG